MEVRPATNGDYALWRTVRNSTAAATVGLPLGEVSGEVMKVMMTGNHAGTSFIGAITQACVMSQECANAAVKIFTENLNFETAIFGAVLLGGIGALMTVIDARHRDR